jgi:hypothetical protein
MGTTEHEFLGGLAGKTVALVGSAASATGTGLGYQIEAHDVVCRVNWSCPVPRRMERDIGTRTDVLYHILTPTGRLRAGVPAWRRARVGMVVSVHASDRPRVRRYKLLAGAGGPPLLVLENHRREMYDRLGTKANTGVLALAHLLQSGLERLTVYGFDMFATGHWLGQLGESPTAAARQAGIVTGHDQPIQRAYLAGLLRDEPRLFVTREFRASIEREARV